MDLIAHRTTDPLEKNQATKMQSNIKKTSAFFL
jgi:hypothetical protein